MLTQIVNCDSFRARTDVFLRCSSLEPDGEIRICETRRETTANLSRVTEIRPGSSRTQRRHKIARPGGLSSHEALTGDRKPSWFETQRSSARTARKIGPAAASLKVNCPVYWRRQVGRRRECRHRTWCPASRRDYHSHRRAAE